MKKYYFLFLIVLVCSCYSFKGGSVPDYLKNIELASTEDISGFAKPSVRQDLTQILIAAFRDDNSLKISNSSSPDSKLDTVITVIRANERLAVSSREYETTRLVTMEVRATFIDNIKKKNVFKDKAFYSSVQYPVSSGSNGETEALKQNMKKISNDILLEIVSAW